MKFSAKHDIDAPISYVFEALSDFDSWELVAMRRGAEVMRTDRLPQKGHGLTWHVTYPFRGRTRKVDLKVIKMARPIKLEFSAISTAVDATVIFDLVEMSAKRTRIQVILDVTPLTLTAKLFIQSLRLARNKVDRRFKNRITGVLTDVEARYQGEQMPS